MILKVFMRKFPLGQVLLIILAISVATVVSVEFWLFSIPELFKGAAKLGALFVNLSLSYIAGYIFYILTVVVPKHIEREHVKEHASYLINRVLFYILFIMQDSANFKIPQKDLKLKRISEADFKLAMKDVFMDHPLAHTRIGVDGKNMKVGDSVSGHIEDLKKTVNELFKHMPYIEPELISLVTSALRNEMNESWPNRNRLDDSYIRKQLDDPGRLDTSIYARCLSDYHEVYKGIEAIFCLRYAKTKAAMAHVKNIKDLNQSSDAAIG